MAWITVQQAAPRSHPCTWSVDVSENTLPLEMGMILCKWSWEPWCRSPGKLSRPAVVVPWPRFRSIVAAGENPSTDRLNLVALPMNQP